MRFKTRYTIKYIPTMGEAGFVSKVEWEKPHFNYNDPNGDSMLFTSSERDRFFRTFPHLQFVSIKV